MVKIEGKNHSIENYIHKRIAALEVVNRLKFNKTISTIILTLILISLVLFRLNFFIGSVGVIITVCVIAYNYIISDKDIKRLREQYNLK